MAIYGRYCVVRSRVEWYRSLALGEGTMRKSVAFLLMVGLLGCAPQVKSLWIRADGQTGRDSPAVEQQFAMDKAVCEGEMQKANMSGSNYCQGLAGCVVAGAVRGQQMETVGKGCMAERGYMLVPEPEAEAKAAELRSIAANNRPAPVPQVAPPPKKPAPVRPIAAAKANGAPQ